MSKVETIAFTFKIDPELLEAIETTGLTKSAAIRDALSVRFGFGVAGRNRKREYEADLIARYESKKLEIAQTAKTEINWVQIAMHPDILKLTRLLNSLKVNQSNSLVYGKFIIGEMSLDRAVEELVEDHDGIKVVSTSSTKPVQEYKKEMFHKPKGVVVPQSSNDNPFPHRMWINPKITEHVIYDSATDTYEVSDLLYQFATDKTRLEAGRLFSYRNLYMWGLVASDIKPEHQDLFEAGIFDPNTHQPLPPFDTMPRYVPSADNPYIPWEPSTTND